MADRQDHGPVTSTSPAVEGTISCPVDQDHLLLDDGTIVAVHGWLHPPGFVVGEVTYLPDSAGCHRLLGRNYRKAYVREGLSLPEERRYRIRDATGSFFDDAQMFRAKSIVGVHRIKRYLPCTEGIEQQTAQLSSLEAVTSTWRSARALLGVAVDNVGVAVTGSLNLLPEAEYGKAPNDVDLVFTGSMAGISALVSAMSAVTRSTPETRVYEYGKGWQIRLRADGWLLCSFFRYADRREAALRGLRGVRTRHDDVNVRGRVVDDAHNAYMPTVLTVEVIESNLPGTLPTGQALAVVISHLRSRGELFTGDIGAFHGSLVEIKDESGSYLALSVLDGDSARLLTPPWRPY